MPTNAEYDKQLALLDEILVKMTFDEMTPVIKLRVAMLRQKALLDEAVIPAPTEMFHAGPPGTKDKLPKIKPIPGKRIKSTDVACPSCLVKAGEPCVRMNTRGQYAKPTGEPKEGYHITRLQAARSARK